ncbi:hypothetical protein U0070_019933 [Myodes glareolus]|uniref:palmitoyl-protein hydrolase n=1 Tax=Myodes glareolus TaxID=447135 RepID=A0AAW0JKC0_MYOGA
MAVSPSAVRLQRCVVSPAGRHSASLIFLHGSGHSGQGLREWIKTVLNQDLTFQHIKIIYPTAPSRPYTPMKGGLSNVWFDRFKISNDCPEHLESIDGMRQVLTKLIDDEVKSGIQKSRILIGEVFITLVIKHTKFLFTVSHASGDSAVKGSKWGAVVTSQG